MAGASCELTPRVNGEDSVMYKKLFSMIKNRPLTNLIYSNYLLPEVVADMDRLGYKRNNQGQHNAIDIYKYFDCNQLLYEATTERKAAIQAGAIDTNGNVITYDNAEDAISKAQQHNQNAKGTVATVFQKGDKYTIVVEERNSKTQNRAAQINTKMQQWNAICHAFQNVGINIKNLGLPQSIISAFDPKQAVSNLLNIAQIDNKWLDKDNIKTILEINHNTPQVQRLLKIFGSMDDVVNKIFDSYRQGGVVTSGQKALIEATLTSCKKFPSIDLQALYDDVNQIADNIATTSTEGRIEDVIKDLDQKYHINKEEIILTGKDIRSLKEAAAESILTIQRQIKKWRAEKHDTTETEALEDVLQDMMRHLDAKRYYKGIVSFLDEAVTRVQDIETLLSSIATVGDTMSNISLISNTLMNIKSIQDGYMPIVKALISVEILDKENQLTDAEKQDIETNAKKILDFFDRKEMEIKDLRKETMTDIVTYYLGDSLVHSEGGFNIIEMADADCSIWDYFYGASECSDIVLSVFGSVMREAQDKRDKRLNDISLRIRRANNKLFETTNNTEFMYEDNGYIISDRDWSKFNEAKDAYRKKLQARGVHGVDLYEEMKQWENQNTEDREVDKTTGRNEKVPNSKYAKAFPTLTSAQLEYYNTIMQIKGELGTLLPIYAQQQFVPPQKRRSFVDAIHATKNEGSKNVIKALQSKFKELLGVRDDDPRYARNGIIQGDEYGIASGTLSNTLYRQIPIFYIKRIEEQGELLKDFSGALQSLASTAINYSCMSEVRDTLEFMSDFLTNDRSTSASRKGMNIVDRVNTGATSVLKRLTKGGNTSKTLIDGWMNAHLYGSSYEDTSRMSVIMRNVMKYTSFKSLSMNLKGAINNFDVAVIQMIIEAGGGEYYNTKDLMWAAKHVLTDNTFGAPGRFWDFVTNNVNSESVLLSQIFDPLAENFQAQGEQRYYKGMLRHLIGTDLSFIGYGAGEHPAHFLNMYAILHATKVKINGKSTSLYDAFEVSKSQDGNSTIALKPNVTYTNEQGQEVPVDEEYIRKIRRKIRGVNRQTHGGMDEGSKGVVHGWILGKALMVLKQWMVGHYSRRFRGEHFDYDLGKIEGYYTTVGKLALGLIQDVSGLKTQAALHWSELSDHQKHNVRKVCTELGVLGLLYVIQMAFGDAKDHKHDYWTLLAIYLNKRALMEVNASNPVGIWSEATKMVDSPVASTSVINGFLYPIYLGIKRGDINKEVERGRHKGENLYWYRIKKYTVPWWKDYEQIKYWDDGEGMKAIQYLDQLGM